MQVQRTTLALGLAVALAGCATVQYGDKATEARLRELLPVPGKTSLYICREAAAFVGAGNRTTVIVDKQPIGTLKPANFAHVVVDPGPHEVYIKRNPGGDSGVLAITSQPGEVAILWVGMTGGGFGVLTIDHFGKRSDAEQCVKGAEYAVMAGS